MKPQNPIYILPSEQAAERKRREMFAASKEAVWLGEEVFSLPHFLESLADPARPIFKRLTQKYLIAHCLRTTPLRHFEKLKKIPSLAQTFLEAIRRLKQWALRPDDLEAILKEAGSLKEHDLWQVYQKYEEEKEKLGWCDPEDLYFLKPSSAFAGRKIIFENFSEKPKAPARLAKQLNAQWRPIPDIRPEDLAHVRLFSLPTPFQETSWFCRRLAELFQQGVFPSEAGILGDGASLELEACWQKLRNLELVEAPSPFMTWLELPAGRRLLEEAAAIDREKAPLQEWLAALRDIPEPLQVLAFQDDLLPLETLHRPEWLAWAAEALREKPEIKTDQCLQGLQWLDLFQGDFPSLKFLWVPFLSEGHFPKITPSIFFQDPKDRARPEWSDLCEAFPDAPALYQQKQKNFLYLLSKTKQAVWLTHSRLDSFGSDLSPSPFTWVFGEAEVMGGVEPILTGLRTLRQGSGQATDYGPRTLKQKIKIERERTADRPENRPFHAQLDGKEWAVKIPAMAPDHIFSPSQLEMYAACPFKYFANRVLGIPQQKEHSPELDPDDRGTLFHDSMETFMRENAELFLEARENRDREPLLLEKLGETVEAVFEKSKKTYPYGHPELYEHLKQKTLHQAVLVLQKELEEARAIEAPLEPAHFEWTFGKGESPPFEMEGLRLGGRIDRIDIDPKTGHFLVLDYKTGTVKKFKAGLLEGLSLQLPLYILAVRKLLFPNGQAVGGLLVESKGTKKKTGLVDAAFNKTHFQIHRSSHSLMKTEEMEALLQQAAQWAADYVKQIRSGLFSARPKECKAVCDYKEICRYAGKPFV